MNWVQLLLAAFSLGKELIKYMQSKQENKKLCAKDIKDVANNLREGRKNGDTSKIEQAFRDLNLEPLRVQDKPGDSKPA